MSAPAAKDVLAAGVVVFRPGHRVLLVHRPKYDDWSFPKGKLDPGEHAVAAAVREVAEETGLHVRLCLPLDQQQYPMAHGTKTVFYWTGRVVGDDDVSTYRPNDEIDDVRWVDVAEAVDLLTYPHDRATLAEARGRRRRTRAVVVLRHEQARSRRSWRGDDAERPLLRVGERQALQLVPLLAAYGVTRIVSSTSLRCRQSVQPYADLTGWQLELSTALAEHAATPDAVQAVVADVLDDDRCVVVCTHRPVLPDILGVLAIDAAPLEPGEMLVVHVRKGRVVDTERQRTL